MSTKIMNCSCTHDFQDRQYGRGNRVHNWALKANNTGGWRCTVCSKVKLAKVASSDKKGLE